jgi:hypothetical protein
MTNTFRHLLTDDCMFIDMMRVIGKARIKSEPNIANAVLSWMLDWCKVINDDRLFIDMMKQSREAEILSYRDASNRLLKYVTTNMINLSDEKISSELIGLKNQLNDDKRFTELMNVCGCVHLPSTAYANNKMFLLAKVWMNKYNGQMTLTKQQASNDEKWKANLQDLKTWIQQHDST